MHTAPSLTLPHEWGEEPRLASPDHSTLAILGPGDAEGPARLLQQLRSRLDSNR